MVKTKLIGGREIQRRLRKMDPATNSRIVRVALVNQMDWLLTRAAKEYFVQGPKVEPGQSWRESARKMPPNAPPGPLVSRSGTGGRSGSGRFASMGLAPSLLRKDAVNRSDLPKSISGGSTVNYAAINEFGKGSYPARPYLSPALSDLKTSGKGASILRQAWEKFGVRP